MQGPINSLTAELLLLESCTQSTQPYVSHNPIWRPPTPIQFYLLEQQEEEQHTWWGAPWLFIDPFRGRNPLVCPQAQAQRKIANFWFSHYDLRSWLLCCFVECWWVGITIGQGTCMWCHRVRTFQFFLTFWILMDCRDVFQALQTQSETPFQAVDKLLTLNITSPDALTQFCDLFFEILMSYPKTSKPTWGYTTTAAAIARILRCHASHPLKLLSTSSFKFGAPLQESCWDSCGARTQTRRKVWRLFQFLVWEEQVVENWQGIITHTIHLQCTRHFPKLLFVKSVEQESLLRITMEVPIQIVLSRPGTLGHQLCVLFLLKPL